MSGRQRIPNSERFPYLRDENGRSLCRVCKKPVEPPKRTFCSPRCLRDFMMQTNWNRVRRVVYERDGGVCMKCGKRVSRKNFHVDHIIPVSEGGAEWDLSNLELSCPECNLRKGKQIDFEAEQCVVQTPEEYIEILERKIEVMYKTLLSILEQTSKFKTDYSVDYCNISTPIGVCTWVASEIRKKLKRLEMPIPAKLDELKSA